MILDFLFRNNSNNQIGKNQEFERLLEAEDIDAVKERMHANTERVLHALSEYNTETHEIMRRPDKVVTDKKGAVVRVEKVWKLPIPYPVYINEIALTFMYGRPVQWIQNSEGTDDAFKAYTEFIKHTRFNSKIRECKRLAGSETESAILFRTYQNKEGRADCQIRVLAKSKGDEIYTRFDQYENLLAFAWGYSTIDDKETQVYHFDIFTSESIYRCSQREAGWEVHKETNLIGKIPVIYFSQEKEWAGVEELIKREESIASRNADSNDYFCSPLAIMNADVIKNMPEKGEVAKLLITNSQEGVNNAAKYLTWDNAPQSQKQELEWLQSQILQKTFTPNITLDTLKSVSQLSAKALETVMWLAKIKANKRKETHDEMMDRTSTLITSIIANVLDVSLASQCSKLIVAHEWQNPFGEDVKEALDNIIRSVDAGIMSNSTAVEMNPIVKDSIQEEERIAKEKEEAVALQQQMFKTSVGEEGEE